MAELQPGPEMDEAVAKATDWLIMDHGVSREGISGPLLVRSLNGKALMVWQGTRYRRRYSPSTDVACAIGELDDVASLAGNEIDLARHMLEWHVRFKHNETRKRHNGFAIALPHAICLAILDGEASK